MSKILIVEDDHNLGIMLQEMLELSGYEIKLSRNPENTNSNIIDNNIDLVLLDKLILGVDGTDVCAHIRETDSVSKTHVIMMSALSDAREVCLNAGASDFIYKPFEMTELLSKIENLLKMNSEGSVS